MKKISLFLALFIVGLSSCVKDNGSTPDPTQTTTTTLTQTLVTNPWKVDKVTDAGGALINPNNLPTESKALFGINIQFYDDKTVRALDPIARTVVNGGKWDFLDNNSALDIDISQLKGQFPIVSLKKERMILKNKVVVSGLTFDVLLELVPSI